MNTSETTIANLFLQLGLAADEQSISRFIQRNQLPKEVHIARASFWSTSQRQFIDEQMEADAEWSIVVDELNECLHEEAYRS